MDMDSKTCPACAESIKRDALICRYCGYDFRTGLRPPSTPPPPAPASQATTNGLAIASLILGLVWFFSLGSILALIFGYVAKSQIDRSGGQQTGRGLAIAGIVLGWIGVAGIIIFIITMVSVCQGAGVSGC